MSFTERSSMLLLFFCCLFLRTSFGRPTSNKKQVKKGESIILFENVNINDTVRLYINGKQNKTKIVDWTMNKTNIITATWFQFAMNNYSRIFMDPERNIWVVNADKNYEGTYSILKYPSFNVTLIISDSLTDEVEKITKKLDESEKKTNEGEENTKYFGCCVACCIIAFFTGSFTALVIVRCIIYRKRYIKRCACKVCWKLLKKCKPYCEFQGEKNGSEGSGAMTPPNRTGRGDVKKWWNLCGWPKRHKTHTSATYSVNDNKLEIGSGGMTLRDRTGQGTQETTDQTGQDDSLNFNRRWN